LSSRFQPFKENAFLLPPLPLLIKEGITNPPLAKGRRGGVRKWLCGQQINLPAQNFKEPEIKI